MSSNLPWAKYLPVFLNAHSLTWSLIAHLNSSRNNLLPSSKVNSAITCTVPCTAAKYTGGGNCPLVVDSRYCCNWTAPSSGQ